MGQNPNRTPKNQSFHNNILNTLALNLQSQGFNVQADHISWPNGCPKEVNGHIPDVIATSSIKGNYILEVEDCTSYADEHTMQQLKSFSNLSGYTCYIIVPSLCIKDNKDYYINSDVQTLLNIHGLSNVKVGLYNCDNKQITYGV